MIVSLLIISVVEISCECEQKFAGYNYFIFFKRSRDGRHDKEEGSTFLRWCPFSSLSGFDPPLSRCVKGPDASLCRQMEGLFGQPNEGRLLRAEPWLPWSLICSWGVHWHCLVSMEGTEPKAGWRLAWQSAFQGKGTIGAWSGRDKQEKDEAPHLWLYSFDLVF